MNYPVDPRYQNGKLYFLHSKQYDLEHPHTIKNLYFGSTIGTLNQRYERHKGAFRQWKKGKYSYVSSFELLKYDDCEIVLIRNFPCRNKFELERFEGNIILKFWEKCFNIHVPGRTKEEQKQQQKEYHEINKEKIKQKHSKSILCECGRIITIGNKPRHLRTEIHKKIMEVKKIETPKKK